MSDINLRGLMWYDLEKSLYVDITRSQPKIFC